MAYRTETRISGDALPETVNLFDVAEKVRPEKKENFYQFWRGVNYGLDIAGGLTAHQQAEPPHTGT